MDKSSSEATLGYIVPKLRDTLAFQRLRGIRQNGLTNFVFAGMEHSRFVHSFGVFDLARTMYDRIIRNSGRAPDNMARSSVAVSGMLHDLGHGPFSHTLEEALSDDSTETVFKHEQLTVRFLTEDSAITAILKEVDDNFANQILAYVDKSYRQEDDWTHRLISSQLDADRLDYMLRDSYMSGIEGHGFDLSRLLEMLSTQDGLRITVNEGAIEGVEAYLLMNLHLYRIAYFHKVVRGSHGVLVSIIQRSFDLIREKDYRHLAQCPDLLKQALLQLFEKGSMLDLDLYTRLVEHHFWVAFDAWRQADDKVLADLAKRLASRQPFRAQDIDFLNKAKEALRLMQDGPEEIATRLGFTADEVRKYYLKIDDPKRRTYNEFRWRPTETNTDEAIWIAFNNGGQEPVERLRKNKVLQAMLEEAHFNRILFPRGCEDIVEKYYP